eukprot:491289_1
MSLYTENYRSSVILMIVMVVLICALFNISLRFSVDSTSLGQHTITGTMRVRPFHELTAGIVLFAFNSEDKKLCMQYLTEANNLCIRLLSKNSNQSVHLNISLFTVERYYNDYIAHAHKPHCHFDRIIFLNQLQSNQSLDKHDYIRFGFDKGREWYKRILLLPYSPYYITMALDVDMYPCHPFDNITHLYYQMETKQIDFAYTSFMRYKYPQNGLFLYRKNNRTNYLFEEWYKYHTTNKIFNDQPSLNATIGNMLNQVNIYLLNNRYNYRGFGRETKNHNQLLYPNNKIIMFHRRAHVNRHPERTCQILNKYPNTLSMAYDDGNVHNCFKDQPPPTCLEYYKYLNRNPKLKKHWQEIYNLYKFFWSDDYHCQWNESVDFVPYLLDTCT